MQVNIFGTRNLARMSRSIRMELPSLAKEGWPRHQENTPVPLKGADGVVRSTSDNRWLERTTPSAPAKEASRLFLDGRSHPSFAKEGSLPAPAASSATRVRAKRGVCPL